MILSSAQKTALKNAILAEPSLSTAVSVGNHTAIAAWVNQDSTFIVWKGKINTSDLVDSYDWDEMAALTDASYRRLTLMTQADTINPSRANVRQLLSKIFVSPAFDNTRSNILAIARRFASQGEKVLATGVGTAGNPGTLGNEGPFSVSLISEVLNG